MNYLARIRLLVAVAALVPVAHLGAAQSMVQSAAPERVDEATGAVWLLVYDTAHPAAPARWKLIDSGSGRNGNAMGSVDGKHPAVIRAGDRIALEEHTAVSDAHLAATALTSAAVDGSLRVRIGFSGQIVEARAIQAGKAEEITEPSAARLKGAEAWR